MTVTIKRIYIRRYRDNGQVTAYCEWSDGSRTEGSVKCMSRNFHRQTEPLTFGFGWHMHALFNRARRDGLRMERETW